MALSTKDLVTLAKITASANPSTSYSFKEEKFSYADLNETLREELKALAPDYYSYMKNKNTIFALMGEVVDDVLPKKVLEEYGQFAEIKTFKQGDKPVFTQRITASAKRRAKQFVTKVGLAGIYEVFKLDGKSFEVQTSAYGGAAQIGFEEFLDGRIDFADVLDIILTGLDEAVYLEIERALKGSIDSLPKANFHSTNAFVEADMDKLIAIADSYGQATIYCTYEFAATMVPSEGWASNAMKDEKWANGYLANYKGHRVIVLPQSFEDETNTQKVIDPSIAWIIPTGADKPVRVALEGQAIVKDYENKDLSREIQIYKKMGVVALVTNDICVYQNTSLTY
jgi:hypothetical protein